MFTLIPCAADGTPLQAIPGLPDALTAPCAQSAALYQKIGYVPPWISYIAMADGQAVGGGAFVGAPKNGFVEIAYFTLDARQGCGYASQTAHELVAIARRNAPDIKIKAFTLPQINPSTKILTRQGFVHVGNAHDVDAGEVWEWHG